MGLRLEDDFGANFQHQSTYIAPNSFVTVGPGSGAVFGGPIVSPQMTNLLVKTEDFSDALWSKSGVIVSSDTTPGPSGGLADPIIWQSTSGNIFQNGLQSVVASGFIYTFSVWLKGAVAGQVAHIGIGGDVFWKNDPIILTTDWQRVEVFGMHEKGPSGSVVRARIYPPVGSLVYAWGAQLEIGPSATNYLAANGTTHQTRPIQYETDCIYVPKQTQNYYKNNLPPTITSWSAFAGSITTSSLSSPLGLASTTLFQPNSVNTNHVIFAENIPASSVVSKISGVYKPLNTFGIYTFAPQGGLNGFLYSSLTERRIFNANSQNSSGFIQNLGDGWSLVEHYSQNELTGTRNEFGITSYGRNTFSGTTLSPAGESLLIAGLWNSRTLGTTPITSNSSISSGTILEDLFTTPIGSYKADQGTIMFDAYIDWGIGIGTDSSIRTLFDASASSATQNRILLYKDLAANKYNLEVYGVSGQVTGTVTLQLSIGWHRFAVSYASGSCSLWIDGVQRISLSSGVVIGEVGTLRIGGNKFSQSSGFGGWIKNFYIFRTALSSLTLADYTGPSRTGYNSYRTESTVVRRYQMFVDQTFSFSPQLGYIWGGIQNGATATITSGAIDPFGGNLAYRIQAGNAPATREKFVFGTGATTIINGISRAFFGVQDQQFHGYYSPNTRSYTLSMWARANQLSPQPSFSGNLASSPNITSSWQLLTPVSSFTPTSVGSLLQLLIRVPTVDQATGTIDVELFNPLINVDVSIRAETISPKSDDIPFTSGMVYKLKCAGNLNHGHFGIYESDYLDMGRNTTETDYIRVDLTQNIPDGSTVVYEYFASDDDTEDAINKWKSSIDQITGRFFKVKVSMTSESVETANPEVITVKPRPRRA